MFAIIGIIVVFGAIIGGYLMEHGHLAVLMQPAELLIIGGAALGTVLIGNPVSTVIQMAKGMVGVFMGSPYNRGFHLETLRMLYELFSSARKSGLTKLEADIDEPAKSPIFGKYKAFAKNHHALLFLCDTLRVTLSGGVGHFELDQMMEMDMETHHHAAGLPVVALSTMADSLPGLGIVAAVLGVVITMGSLGGPPEEIGHKVAAALVGTFLGILLCYGFFGPIASNMSKLNDAEMQYYQCLRMGIISFAKGSAPILAVEFARRTIPHEIRPSFVEMEKACKSPETVGAPPAGSVAPAAAAKP
jgi:chemotaxis protein MotA